MVSRAILREIDKILQSDRPPDQKVEMIARFRELLESEGRGVDLMEILIRRGEAQRQGLVEARKCIEELKQNMEEFMAPPLHFATFWCSTTTEEGPRAEVVRENGRTLVAIGESVNVEELQLGDEILLNAKGSLLMGKYDGGRPHHGGTAVFSRLLDDGRLVLESRDEEVVVEPGPGIVAEELKPGDLVLFNRAAGLAHEMVRRSEGKEYFVEETPHETFQQIGGLAKQIDEILEAVELMGEPDETAAKYGIKPVRGMLLYGPPGVGKTLVARALANYLARISGYDKAYFMYVKPSEDNSYLFSQSERNIRKRFQAAAEAADRAEGAPVIMFCDEIDAMGAVRGARLREVNDRVLQAFLAELQGLCNRPNVLVIGATNRADALDPALVRPGRLGDSLIEIPRPGRRAAREIFGKYLTDDLCYAVNPDVESERMSVIEAGVSAIFASNGDGELARLTFRDGTTRAVHRADLVNGAVIANIANKASRFAWRREKRGGEAGVLSRDVLAAVGEEFQALARILTPVNCRNHLSGIPWDLDVVDVAPATRRVARPLSYMRIGA